MESIVEKTKLTIREATPKDFVAIKSIAINSFPKPKNWHLVSANLEQYRYGYLKQTPQGEMNVAVAENKDHKICAYIYYQCRTNRDLYLFELAANPPNIEEKVCGAGAILLKYAIEHATSAINATLNIVHSAQENPKKLITYYEQFGFQTRPELGYTAIGKPRDPENTWMTTTNLEKTLARINQYLLLKYSQKNDKGQISTRLG